MAAGDVILVLSPPGAIDAKGNYKNSIPVSSLITTGGEMMFYGFSLTWVDDTGVTIGVGSLSLADGASQYKSTLASPLTISMDVSGAGGLDTGTKQAYTWYHVWYIVNKTSGTSSAVFSLSTTSPTLPTGYTLKRRIGSICSDSVSTGKNVTPFVQRGNGPDKTYMWVADKILPSNMTIGAKRYISFGTAASPLASRATVRTALVSQTDPANPMNVFYYARSIITHVAETVYTTTTNSMADVICFVENGELGYVISNGEAASIIVSWEDNV